MHDHIVVVIDGRSSAGGRGDVKVVGGVRFGQISLRRCSPGVLVLSDLAGGRFAEIRRRFARLQLVLFRSRRRVQVEVALRNRGSRVGRSAKSNTLVIFFVNLTAVKRNFVHSNVKLETSLSFWLDSYRTTLKIDKNNCFYKI